MKRRNYRAKRQAATFPLWPLLKGALLATAVILLLMGMWTLLLYGGIASLGTIPLANAVLKFLGAGLAAFLSANKSCSRPALYGGLGGVLFWGLTFLSMSAFTGEWALNWAMLGDMAVSLAVGMAAGAAVSLLRQGKS